MSPDLLGTIVLDGRPLGALYFPAMPEVGQFLEAGADRYAITAVTWVTPGLGIDRGLAAIRVEVRAVTD
jgi:hypothetical protein